MHLQKILTNWPAKQLFTECPVACGKCSGKICLEFESNNLEKVYWSFFHDDGSYSYYKVSGCPSCGGVMSVLQLYREDAKDHDSESFYPGTCRACGEKL